VKGSNSSHERDAAAPERRPGSSAVRPASQLRAAQARAARRHDTVVRNWLKQLKGERPA